MATQKASAQEGQPRAFVLAAASTRSQPGSIDRQLAPCRLDRLAGARGTPCRIVVVGDSLPEQPRGQPLPLELNTIGPLYEPAITSVRIFRYLASGTLDPSFGKGGIVETSFGLPAPESQRVKLASRPVVEATGVAVDGRGCMVITGGPPAAAASTTTITPPSPMPRSSPG